MFLCVLPVVLLAQNRVEAEKLVNEGVVLHDKGDYAGALSRYDQALELDLNNSLALSEKALTLCEIGRYQDSIEYCKRAIEKNDGTANLQVVYVTYGNNLDLLQKTDEAMAIYAEGIRLYPDYFQLYFNKGIALTSAEKYEQAIACFRKSASLNPQHAGTHHILGRVLFSQNKNIPALMAFCRFLVLEPEGEKARQNVALLHKILKGNVEKTGKKSITIQIDASLLTGAMTEDAAQEDNFASTEMILSMASAMDHDKKNRNKKPIELFVFKMDMICSSLRESKKNKTGFFWDYYAPYLIDLKERDLTETFAYIVNASSEEKSIATWLNSHKQEVKKFYEWSESFRWNR